MVKLHKYLIFITNNSIRLILINKFRKISQLDLIPPDSPELYKKKRTFKLL